MGMTEDQKKWWREYKHRDYKRSRIFQKMKECKDEIIKLHKDNEIIYEDRVYRFYHASFKVFWLQNQIEDILKLLKKLNPHRPYQFDEWFLKIIKEAQDQGSFKINYNEDFSAHARPVLEAYLHCKYFLDMLRECIKIKQEPKSCITSGWASILELYNLR